MEDDHERVYQNVAAEHDRYMGRAVAYKSLRYIRETRGGWTATGDQGAEAAGRQSHGQQPGGSGGQGGELQGTAQPRAAGAQRNHEGDRPGASEGVHGGAKRGHTPPQGDVGGKNRGRGWLRHTRIFLGLNWTVWRGLHTGEPPVELGGKVRLLYKKGLRFEV